MLELAIDIMREVEACKENLIGEVKSIKVIYPATLGPINRPIEVIAYNSTCDSYGSVAFWANEDAGRIKERKDQLFVALQVAGGVSLADIDLVW